MKCWQAFVPRIALAILGVAVVPGLVEAQNYFQDFSANFPDPGQAGNVTGVITDSDGQTIIPYDQFPVPGMASYNGRHQFAARTGGADANQEVSGVTSVYSLGATNTTVEYVGDEADIGLVGKSV